MERMGLIKREDRHRQGENDNQRKYGLTFHYRVPETDTDSSALSTRNDRRKFSRCANQESRPNTDRFHTMSRSIAFRNEIASKRPRSKRITKNTKKNAPERNLQRRAICFDRILLLFWRLPKHHLQFSRDGP